MRKSAVFVYEAADFFLFWGAPRGKCLLSRENNQYNIYKKIQRFAETRRYASNKPSAW